MRDSVEEIRKAGAELIGIDPHEVYPAKHFLKDVGLQAGDVDYPLLLDPANVASAAYGVAFQMRIHTEWSNRPATFVIDRTGVIRFAQRAQTFSDRPTPERILQELKKLNAPK